VSASLSITASEMAPELAELPWDTSLEAWPEETIAALPKGISRPNCAIYPFG
jgi:hypothetical protein